MAQSTLRVGILGTGFTGQTHGKNLAGIPDVQVAAICDIDGPRAAKLKDSLKAEQAVLFDSFDLMLKKAKLDVLYVCLPPFAHEGQVEKAARKGVHLFLEKPIALTVKRAASMAKAIDKAGVKSQVGFHMRFFKAVAAMRRAVAAGETGRPTLFAGRYWCNVGNGSPWWRDVSKSGGQMFEQVIHVFDLASYLLNAKPVSVTATMGNLCHTQVSGYTVEDTSAAIIRFDNGAVASITGSNNTMPVHFMGDFRAVYERALIEHRAPGQSWVRPEESTIWRYPAGSNGSPATEASREEFVQDTNAYKLETEDFINAIRTGGPTTTPVQAGLDAVRLLTAVAKSAGKDGKTVRL